MVNDPVDRRRGRHRVGEHLLPLAEHQVRGDPQRSAFVTLSYQGEQHLGLLGSLRQIAQVVDHQQVEVVQLPEHPWQLQIPLRREHVLHQAVCGDEPHRTA